MYFQVPGLSKIKQVKGLLRNILGAPKMSLKLGPLQSGMFNTRFVQAAPLIRVTRSLALPSSQVGRELISLCSICPASNHCPCSLAGKGEYLDWNAPSSIPDADYYPTIFELNKASFLIKFCIIGTSSDGLRIFSSQFLESACSQVICPKVGCRGCDGVRLSLCTWWCSKSGLQLPRARRKGAPSPCLAPLHPCLLSFCCCRHRLRCLACLQFPLEVPNCVQRPAPFANAISSACYCL